ncbi:HAMP domain-containing sensor histidine kinase [Zafaria sp. Z1313]|uniref:sensor histidine kinase n=1 Tax=unclassified Zafaria TaxID=2828765 RepID=UPI002E7780A1|nr:HAMP domain-containing sensor histidine kinase [Zafaria sp. J156]MEE1620446.1 HAMP domain-containing sensor histidine kinase [Zafaria sp. J156]
MPERARSRGRGDSMLVRGSVGARLLTSMILLALLTLVVAGATSYGLQRSQVAARIDDSLARSVREFRVLAEGGVSPETGQPFTLAEDLVYLAMQRTLPAANEGLMALNPTGVRWQAPESVSLRLEQDRQLVDAVIGAGAPERVTLHNLTTTATNYRLVVLPVQLEGDEAPMLFVLAYDSEAELAELNQSYAVFFGAGIAALMLATLLGGFLVSRLLQPLRQLRTTAENITEHDLDRRLTVSGTDDLADLSRTFNHMLDRLQAALGSQRQLLDDVGHELRTPITIIQGHLELQDNNDPEDVAQSRAIALDELDRMGLLVEDLVTLAKSDRADFVQHGTVELDHLLDDVVDKAAALGERRWIVEQRGHGTVQLDPRRITQAMLQLCQNAVKFSADGSTVALGSALLGDTLRLWVRDEGVGIRPEDREEIFLRFARGSNGSRAEGSGLGLTIVDAIAAAHGGTVSVQSTPGVGSTFYLDLPAGGSDAPETERQAREPDPDH